jgi:hypothetical protein
MRKDSPMVIALIAFVALLLFLSTTRQSDEHATVPPKGAVEAKVYLITQDDFPLGWLHAAGDEQARRVLPAWFSTHRGLTNATLPLQLWCLNATGGLRRLVP